MSTSFGVLYDDLVEKYDSSRAGVGWILTIRWIFIFGTGMFISPFIDKYGCRTVGMVSGILYGVSSSLCAVSSTITWLYITYGVLAGTGNCGIFLCSINSIKRLFSANRGLATCLSAIGFTVGVIIHPLYTSYFLDLYGVSGVLLIQGGFTFQTLLCVFGYTSLERRTPTIRSKKGQVQRTSELTTISGSSVELDGKKPNQESPSHRTSDPVHKHDFLKNYLKEVTDFKLLKKISFVLANLHYILFWMIMLGLTTHIVGCAEHVGISTTRATQLLSISGFVNLCTAPLVAIVVNLPKVNPALVTAFGCLSGAASVFYCAFSQRYEIFIGASVLTGIVLSIAPASLPMLVLRAVGIKRFSRGLALIWTLLMPAAIGSSAFVGWMVDIFGNYVIAFVVLGISGIVSFILALCVAIITGRRDRINTRLVVIKETISQETITTYL
ncbi:hypothetical protein LSH36_690g02013 [Paralvinella palmiformis]|uniref:Uncharacterized protein n=1 Tax=Paralvinella palmiformis TaxID=53620 RepID=A0AAD9MTJ9_9ANNE|nr:hypothetical protein LSH36_690g02013 [Paralvinella palmiformis]